MSLIADQTSAEHHRAPPVPDEAFEPVLRWLVFTGVSVFAAVLLWRYGLMRAMIVADRTRISSIIAALYVAASGHCLWRAFAISRESQVAAALQAPPRDAAAWAANLPRRLVADHVRDLCAKASGQAGGRLDQTLLLRALAERLAAPNKLGALAADTLLKLGLLGTIIGFILMLGPVAGLDGADPASVKAAMGVMSTGLAVAMYTTLAGLIGAILLKAQYLLLEAATTKLFWDVVRTTETKIVPALERPDV
jgi:hypothetical protein